MRIKEIKDLDAFTRPRYKTIKMQNGDVFRGHVVLIVRSKFKDTATGEFRKQLEIREPPALERVFVPLNQYREEFIKLLIAKGVLVPIPRDNKTPEWVEKQFMTAQPESSFLVRKERIYIIAVEKITPTGTVYLVPEMERGEEK